MCVCSHWYTVRLEYGVCCVRLLLPFISGVCSQYIGTESTHCTHCYCSVTITVYCSDAHIPSKCVLCQHITRWSCIFCHNSLSSYIATDAVVAVASYKFWMYQLFLILVWHGSRFPLPSLIELCIHTHTNSLLRKPARPPSFYSQAPPAALNNLIFLFLRHPSPTVWMCVCVLGIHRVQCRFTFGKRRMIMMLSDAFVVRSLVRSCLFYSIYY